MKKTSKKIVFFGSGPVAAKSLRLLADDFTIEAVITKPRAAHHKGDVPVLSIANELGITIYTANTKHELDTLISGLHLTSEVAILIDFGIIVSSQVIDFFEFGIVNSHFSLLPEWRGADPITFAILYGQKQTGVSLMLLVPAMDEGPLLATTQYEIPAGTTSPDLTTALIDLSYRSLVTILPLYLAGTAQPIAQDSSIAATYSRKLTKTDGLIDWTKSAVQIEREIRAYLEWPKSKTMLSGKDVIITKARVIELDGKPGQILEKQDRLIIACGQNSLGIMKLKPAGKKEMTVHEFLQGYSRYL